MQGVSLFGLLGPIYEHLPDFVRKLTGLRQTMLTPKFSCSQTDASVIITLYVPSVRVGETLPPPNPDTLFDAD